MTTCKRIFSVLLLLVLLGGIVPLAQAELTPEETYNEHLELLNTYMQGGGAENGVSIDTLVNEFSNLTTYKESMNFWMYTCILKYLNENNFTEAISFHTILERQTSFCDMLENEAAYQDQYSAICTVKELGLYVKGRKAEKEGDTTLAGSYYEQCLGCMDARDRFLACRPNLDQYYQNSMKQMQAGNYASAKESAKYLLANGYDGAAELLLVINARLSMEAESKAETNAVTPIPAAPTATPRPVPQYSYTSFTASASASGTKVTLSWSPVRDAATYRVYHAVTKNGNRDFQQLSSTASTSFTHSEAVQGVNNYYQVEALAADGTVVGGCSEVKVYVEPKKQWGSWSGWSTTPVSATSTREVQTKTETEDTYVTKYQYTRWHYYTTKGVWYNSPVEFYNSSIYSSKKEATWQSKTTDTPLSRDGNDPTFGKPMYEGYWFNQTTKQVKSGTKQVTYYRYRELK